jgi:hypothetical protein
MLTSHKLKLGIIVIVMFCACNTPSVKKIGNVMEQEIENEMKEEKDVSFIEIISNIPSLNLPYILYCGLDDSLPMAEIFNPYISEFMPENTMIAGKLPINNDNIYIVYGLIGDIIYPYLNIYDKNGDRIDSLDLHISYCSGDESEIVANTTTIYEDFSIIMIDTTQFIYYNNENEKIIDSIIVKENRLNLTNDGLYKITERKSIRIQ